MYRRIFVILLLIMNLFTLSGCWDRLELEDLGVVSALGIEEASNGKIQIIVQTINTGALVKGAGGRGVEFEKAYRNTVIEGDTVYDALNRLTAITSTKRSLSHTSVFIISEGLARDKGVQYVIDFLERDPQIRLDAWFMIGSGSLVEMLDVPGRITTTPGQRISDIIKHHDETFSYAPLKLAEFITLLESETSRAYTGVVETIPNASLATDPGHGILDGNVPEPVENTTIRKTAVFKQDRLIGFLNRDESRGLHWLKGEVKSGTITFSVPGIDGKKAVTSILRAKSELKPEIIDGQVYITATILVKSFLDDNQAGIKLDKPEEIQAMEAAQSEQVKREIEAALQKAQQEYNVDVFGFGEAVHRKYPGEWKEMKANWSDIFPDVQVNIQVRSLIENTSKTGNAPEPRGNM